MVETYTLSSEHFSYQLKDISLGEVVQRPYGGIHNLVALVGLAYTLKIKPSANIPKLCITSHFVLCSEL